MLLEVYTITGVKMLQSHVSADGTYQYDISMLSKGVYYVNVKSNNSILAKTKLVKL